MLNTYTPPLMLCGTQYRTVECGPPLGCAEWEAGVGTVRVRMTFLWMSDPLYCHFVSYACNIGLTPAHFRYNRFISTHQQCISSADACVCSSL